MKYTTYYEGMHIVDYNNYIQMNEILESELHSHVAEPVTIRKVKFENEEMRQHEGTEHVPVFRLCMKLGIEPEFYLEKKTKQNALTHKSWVELDRTDCKKIISGEIGWMKNHNIQMLSEFYIHYTANHLTPGYITEFTKQIYQYKNKSTIIFNTGIRRALKWNAGFLDAKVNMIDCLNCDKIMVQYKQKASIPQYVANVLHMGSEQLGEPVYSV